MIITIKRFINTLLVVSFACYSSAATNQTKSRKQPNILLLLADDMGYGELGCFGQRTILTPHLDQLAAQGVRLTDFYIGSSVCSPSRAILMTGIHAGKISIRSNRGYDPEKNSLARLALKDHETTVAEMLKGAGYQTAFIGKWHLGKPEDRSTWAQGRGFDFAIQEQWGEDADKNKFIKHMHYKQDGTEIFYDQEKHDCLDEFRTDLAVDFLRNHRDGTKPLFLFMSYRTPHAHEPYIREKSLYSNEGWPNIERQHAARITMLDREVKRLLDTFEDLEELDNTFVLFTSDNGPTIEGGHDYNFFNSSAGLRGHKRHLYEGGIREPFIAYWKKGGITGGRTSNHISAGYDIMPTFAELAGITPPAQTTGISFLPELLGKDQEDHAFLYFEAYELGVKQAVRKGKWKAVRHHGSNHTELYDLKKDRNELVDISYKYPQVVEQLERILRKESTPSIHYPLAGTFFTSEQK